MKYGLLRSIALISSLLMPGAVFAHHGTAVSYDESKTITLTGVVTKFVWSNPHAHILFDVTDESGTVVHWAAEGSSPANWAKLGWNRATLKDGDKITITMHPSKAGTPVGVVTKVVTPDGKTLTRGNVTD
jgi:hypothetical protein